MDTKMGTALLPAPISPRTNNEVMALTAQDSMNMVMTALHNPPLPVPPIPVRTFLARRVSRMTMIGVRQMLSENQIERYGMPAQSCLINSVDW